MRVAPDPAASSDSPTSPRPNRVSVIITSCHSVTSHHNLISQYNHAIRGLCGGGGLVREMIKMSNTDLVKDEEVEALRIDGTFSVISLRYAIC